jgi:uncharacterized RDD family membrane protein YckC
MGDQMSSMPQRDGPEQWGSAQPSDRPEEGRGAGAQQGTMPGQQTGGFPGQQQGAVPDQPYGSQQGQPASQQAQWASQPSRVSPVNEAETRVTWRRIFQYWIDAFFVSIVPYLVSIPFDRSGSRLLHVLGGVVYVVLFVLIGIWYWIIRPHSHNGQTFAMKWFGLRIISKDGGPANMAQLFIRWICLLFDAAPWFWPFTGLLGLIVMLCSRYRQRIGDHAARTLVISTSSGAFGARSPRYATVGTDNMGSQPGMPGHDTPER